MYRLGETARSVVAVWYTPCYGHIAGQQWVPAVAGQQWVPAVQT